MSKGQKIHLLVIDPQNDFLGNDDGTPYSVGSGPDAQSAQLPVKGAVSDMRRLAGLVDRIGPKVDDIHVTLDSHRLIDVGHAAMWVDGNGKQPGPFTLISEADIRAGMWTTRNPNHRQRMLEYAHALESSPSAYKICIWPTHCLIGTWGHNVFPELNAALQRWSDKEFAMVDYVTKGSNPWTEHYGALQAEVPDPSDPGTGLNTALLQTLADADIIGVAGEASSHCVLKTVQQIAENIGAEHVKKFHIIEDCMSPVPAIPNVVDFPAIAKDFFQKMKAQGMTLTNSTDFLS